MPDTTVTMIASKPFAAIFLGLVLTVGMIGAARLSGYQAPSSLPQQVAEETRILKFEDAPQGTVNVRDANTGEMIATFGRGEGSFVRATLRALVNDRRHRGISIAGDFRLERHAGPQLFLIDEVTSKTISLNAFGPSNTAAFAAFLSTPNQGESL
jgi:putative photosynthetic complex assembly protein